MGYTHYIYRPVEIKESAWAKIVEDTKKVFAYIENDLGIALAGGLGEGRPEVNSELIWFNGSDEQPIGMWTTDEDISIPWPAPSASLNEPVADPVAEKTAGYWFAGSLLRQRTAPTGTNGYGSGSYETAGLERKVGVKDENTFIQYHDDEKRDLIFECCKTAYRPYDLAVTAFYTIVKHHVPKTRVSSDGGEEDWMDAMIICHNLLGYPMESPLSE